VLLPTAVWSEKAGSTTNLEGRVQRIAALVTTMGVSLDDWRIASELAIRFGVDFGFEHVEDVQDEIARVAPAFAGVDAELLRRARDGAVLPVAEHPEEITFHGTLGVTSGLSWEPIPPGIATEETHLSSIGTGAVEASGTGSLSTIKPGLTEADDHADEAVAEHVDAATSAMAQAPALHVWDRAVPETRTDPPDAYSLRLVIARKLYDHGRVTVSSPSIARLVGDVALYVHPSDVTRLGVANEGDEVRVTSARTTITLPVRSDTAVAPGTAFIPYAQTGDAGARDLVDVDAPVIDVRVETTR
jgi:NADH-quinone oxidoreductase subunit G